jgi:hypothetical protein
VYNRSKTVQDLLKSNESLSDRDVLVLSKAFGSLINEFWSKFGEFKKIGDSEVEKIMPLIDDDLLDKIVEEILS